jgi:anti-sigma factor RsiW
MLMRALGLVGANPWLTCRQCVEAVTEFLSGGLSPQERDLVLAHLERCPHCPRYVRQIELCVGLARATTPPPAPPSGRAELLDAFRHRHRAREEDT